MHGTLAQASFGKLKALRDRCDLYFDTGDAIKTGNLGVPLKPEPVWPLLEALGCDAGVPGNRESHLLPAVFEAKLKGAAHPILCANLRHRDGTRPLPGLLKIERQGIRVGVVGVMVAMVTAKMRTQAASAYLWDPPVETAREIGGQLRADVDLLIALTHIGHRKDLELAEGGPFDIVLGGHSHTVLQEPQKVGRTWVCQGGSHNRFAGVYTWDGALSGGLVAIAPDL
jgi:2',3'-cyclic-nucleotide 2'-phosphodiesterase (5'-nucleotidase family)